MALSAYSVRERLARIRIEVELESVKAAAASENATLQSERQTHKKTQADLATLKVKNNLLNQMLRSSTEQLNNLRQEDKTAQ